MAKLSEKNDLDSARELTTLYVECNGNQEQKYTELAVKWSEKVMSYKDANQEDLKLYRALHDLDTDTGKPINLQ